MSKVYSLYYIGTRMNVTVGKIEILEYLRFLYIIKILCL